MAKLTKKKNAKIYFSVASPKIYFNPELFFFFNVNIIKLEECLEMICIPWWIRW